MISLILNDNEFDLEKLAAVTAFDGWGMPELKRFATRASQQDGDTDAGYVLEPRFGSLVFRLRETTLEGMYARRNQLVSLFAPENRAKLRWNLAYGVRQFDVQYASSFSGAWQVNDWAAQKFVVTLKANNPLAYDPTIQVVEFSAYSAGTSIPMAVPTPVGSSLLNVQQNVSYGGQYKSSPLVRIFGPITNPKIRNMTTGVQLSFAGYSIAANDYYEIDADFLAQTVVDTAGTNQIAKLSTDSNLSAFSLAAGSDGSQARDNLFQVTGSGANNATKVQLFYYKRFLGI